MEGEGGGGDAGPRCRDVMQDAAACNLMQPAVAGWPHLWVVQAHDRAASIRHVTMVAPVKRVHYAVAPHADKSRGHPHGGWSGLLALEKQHMRHYKHYFRKQMYKFLDCTAVAEAQL